MWTSNNMCRLLAAHYLAKFKVLSASRHHYRLLLLPRSEALLHLFGELLGDLETVPLVALLITWGLLLLLRRGLHLVDLVGL